MRLPLAASAVLLCLLPHAHAQAPPHGLRVPPGFEVTEFADSGLANDIFCLTLDPWGRVVVSGRGYVRLLLDEDGDGKADKALDFAEAPKDGAMGLFWEGETLWCMGDGGLRRYCDAGGAGRQRPSELVAKLKTGGEHDAHAIRRGPDGWLYVLCGNNTGISKANVTLPTSPVKDPIAGCVLRFAPDFKGCEVVADGFRNAYAMDFNSAGDLFTFDSDNERCVSLPWYEPTRLYHVLDGGHYGWLAPQRAQTWRLPPYFLDVVAPIATLGRGSPTGVVCYRHTQFPARYRGGLFLCDWTFGRIYFVKLVPSGSSYRGEAEVFLQAVGDNGFAPTAAAVDPRTGDLYVSIGGRGTRGAVYRIRYPDGLKGVEAGEVAKLQPKPRSNEWQEATSEQYLARATGDDLRERLRTLGEIRRHQSHFRAEQLDRVIRANWGHPDRLLRQQAAALLAAAGPDLRIGYSRKDGLGPRETTTLALACLDREPDLTLKMMTDLLAENSSRFPTKPPADVQLDAVRLLQRAHGDLGAKKLKGTFWEGYSRREGTSAFPDEARAAIRDRFPSGHSDLDRELSRTLAVIEDDDLTTLRKVADRLTDDSDPVEDIHYLIVLARLRAERPPDVTRRVAAALLALDRKLTQRKLNRDTNWPLRVGELDADMARKDPNLNATLLADADFGRPDHALFARAAGFDRRRAAEVFLARAEKDADFPWNAALIELLGELSEEKALPVLRRLWGEHGLDDIILSLLAKNPHKEDRAKFLQGLEAVPMATVRLALDALEKLPRRGGDADEALALVLALRRLPEGKEGDELRGRLVDRLRRTTGRDLKSADDWARWFAGQYPDRAGRVKDADGVDVEAWDRRLAALDWSAGDAGRGKQVFTKAGCAACHSGSQALGPDLQGVAGRFSRADLFTAILRPSKDVAPRYRTTLIATDDGKVYQGLIIYEAVDSVILQTGPAQTIRLTDRQVRERRQTATSLMPAGLLDKLSDRDISDLYAYLKSLGAGRKK
jgi:putative membrane-bound dehydrogenase-like protein